MDAYLKVGELARRSGVSVRTLHHYHELGLLEPSLGGRGEARLYGPREVERLQHILSLRALGLALAEVRACLGEPSFSPLDLVERHLERVTAELELGRKLRDRLQAIAASLRAADAPSTTDLLQAMELTMQMERFTEHYTPEQLEYLARRGAEVGEERIQAVQREWQALFAAYRLAQERGDDPASEAVLELARRGRALIEEFTGGDAGVRQSLDSAWKANPHAMRALGVEAELERYMARAAEALDACEG